MPNSLLEAMAAGRAIIASDVGANAEILDAGRAGVILPKVTAESVSQALRELAECQEKRATLGRAARLRADLEYSIEACLTRLVAHYADAMGSRRPMRTDRSLPIHDQPSKERHL
jgi:glycosyltransferase involved in cell wall biosynthesis